MEAIFDRLLEVARDVTGARYAALGVLDADRIGLAEFITVGIDEDMRNAIGGLPRGRGVLGLLISEPEPLRLDDVGDHPSSYGFPIGHPPMKTFLGVPIVIRGEVWGNLYLADKRGGPFDEADEESAIVLADWAAIAIENERLYQAANVRGQQLGRSVRALEATSEIARAVGGETELDRVLELIAQRSCALVDASGLAILLVDGDDFVVAAIAGQVPRDIVGQRARAAGSVAGRVVATGKPERAESLSSSLRFALGGMGVVATAGLFVPLTFRGAHIGALEAFDRVDGPQFRPEDERMLISGAASAAVAVATAQTVEQDRLRRAIRAAEDERGRWARELHDETLQALGGLHLLLSSARRSEDVGTLHDALTGALEQLGIEIRNLRALITDLRPASLDELGLAPALDALIDRARVNHGIKIVSSVDLAGHAAERLDPELETVIYRIVQEAMNNAGRHARARAIRVEIRELDAEILVSIRDDGVGFDQSLARTGFGLAGIGERVALSGGRLEIDSSTEGTTIEAVLPITRAALKRS